MSEEKTESTSGKPQIYTKIIDVMRAVGAVGKDKVNTHQKYNFRGIDDMYNALHEPMSAAGIFAAPRVLNMTREERQTNSGGNLIYTILEIEHRFYADDGSSVAVVTVGEAMDSGDKSCNKAQSAAYKYALMELFCIPTEERLDSEYETHAVAPRAPDLINTRPQSAPQPPQRANNGHSSDAPACPKCSNSMWDNRAKKAAGSISAKSPDFKCKNKDGCDGVIWPPRDDNRNGKPTADQLAAQRAIPMTGAQPREQLAAEYDADDSDPFAEAPPYPAN